MCVCVCTRVRACMYVCMYHKKSHPSTLTRAKLSMVANALTTDSKLLLSPFSFTGCWQIIVPGAERLKIFLITMGMLCLITGMMVRGCKTFAPKYDCKNKQSFKLQSISDTKGKWFQQITKDKGADHFPGLLIRQCSQYHSLTNCK